MYINEINFDIETIADLIIKHIEELMEDKASVAGDFQILREQFGKVIYLKKKLNVQSLDVVFIYENKRWNELINYEKYKLEIAEIHNRINYKLGQSKKIPMFSRGGIKEVPSFHFPAGLNIWFLEVKKFIKSKVNPIVVVNFEVNGIMNYLKKLDLKLQDELKYYFVNSNQYFSIDKHIEQNWNKK